MRAGHRTLLWAGAGIALAIVFAASLRPDVMVTLANQLWNCF